VFSDYEWKLTDAILLTCLRDIAGEQRFGTMTKTYFRGANAVIIMFDLTNIVSWEDVDVWRQDVLGKLGMESSSDRIPVLIVGNKLDLVSPEKPSVVTDEAFQEYIEKHQLWKGYATPHETGRQSSPLPLSPYVDC